MKLLLIGTSLLVCGMLYSASTAQEPAVATAPSAIAGSPLFTDPAAAIYSTSQDENYSVANSFTIFRAGDERDGELRQALEAYQNADSEEQKQDSKATIREALDGRYETFLEEQSEQIEELDKRVQELRAQLVRRREAKERMVELKMEMLISQADGLGWPENNGGNNFGIDIRHSDPFLNGPMTQNIQTGVLIPPTATRLERLNSVAPRNPAPPRSKNNR